MKSSPGPLQPLAATIYCLSLWTFPFWTLHMNKIMQRVDFRDRLIDQHGVFEVIRVAAC